MASPGTAYLVVQATTGHQVLRVVANFGKRLKKFYGVSSVSRNLAPKGPISTYIIEIVVASSVLHKTLKSSGFYWHEVLFTILSSAGFVCSMTNGAASTLGNKHFLFSSKYRARSNHLLTIRQFNFGTLNGTLHSIKFHNVFYFLDWKWYDTDGFRASMRNGS